MATTGEKIKLVITLSSHRKTIQTLLHQYRQKAKATGLTAHDKRKVRRLEAMCQDVENQLRELLPPDRNQSNF